MFSGELTAEYQQGYCDGMRLLRAALMALGIQHEEMWEHINAETKKEQKILAELKEAEAKLAHDNNECEMYCHYCDED